MLLLACPSFPQSSHISVPSLFLVLSLFFCLQANSTCSLAVVAYSTDVQSQNTHSRWNCLNYFPEQEAKILQRPVTSQIPGQSGITGSSTSVSFIPHSPSSSGCSESELLLTVLGQKPDETDQVTYQPFLILFPRHECFFEILKDTDHFLEAHLKGYLNSLFPYMDIKIKFCEVLQKKKKSFHYESYIYCFHTKVKIDFV